jgi:hypothetical protein
MSLLIYIICAEVSVRGGDAAGMRNVVVFEGVSDVCRGQGAESGERRAESNNIGGAVQFVLGEQGLDSPIKYKNLFSHISNIV